MREPIGLGSALGAMRQELARAAPKVERQIEMNPERAFINFRNSVLELCSHEVRQEHFATFGYGGIENGVVKIEIGTNLNYEFIQANMKGVFQSLYNTHLAHLATGLAFKLAKPKRPFIERELSQQKLTAFLAKQDIAIINPGVSTSARELLGLFVSFYNNKKPSAQMITIERAERRQTAFRLQTSYAGFAAARVPEIRSTKTIREHIDRLLKVGVFTELSDAHLNHRATSFWLVFNPAIIVFRYSDK